MGHSYLTAPFAMLTLATTRTATQPAVRTLARAPSAGAAGPSAPDTARHVARCSTCAMRHLCMPQGMSAEELPKLEALICKARTVRRGEPLYRAGAPFENLYAVRSGSL